MDKLNMKTKNIADENYAVLAKLFPNALTETITGYDENGNAIVERAIDADVLRQEISCKVVEGRDERYQFTWPDKKKSILLANAPISATLRPCREESVDFDNTENLYIEGDNLEVLKLLQETYLGKVKMLYIDPPYNTGNDFVYDDNFIVSMSEYIINSGQWDEEGNRLVQNSERNGRFHTDWLNMMYPRLKLAKNLLTESGAIFIHIDEHEVYTMSMICNEIFGKQNELGTIVWDKRNPKGVVAGVAYQHEYILVYSKNIVEFAEGKFSKKKEHADEMLAKVNGLIKKHGVVNDVVRKEYKEWIKQNSQMLTGGERAYSLIDEEGRIYQPVSMAAPDKPENRSHRPLIHPQTGKICPVPEKGWRFTDKKMDELVVQGKIEYGIDETTQPRQKYFLTENMEEAVSSLLYYGGSDDALGVPFDNPKPVYVVKKIISTLCKEDDVIMDFFSGSATVAHATMQLNSEDGRKRKYILVQLPEKVVEKSIAYKKGFSTICDIGKERMRKAGSIITSADTGFRVLKLDTSNMKEVYYNPSEIQQHSLFESTDNIKEDRTSEDLLFQVMLDLGVLLSSKIEETEVAGKKIFNVADNFLVACFDNDITEETVKAVAQMEPYYAVFRDSCMANDSVATNFDQIFATYSPSTVRKVL